jgi:hypothetical protein
MAAIEVLRALQRERCKSSDRHGGTHQLVRAGRDHAGRQYVVLQVINQDIKTVPDTCKYRTQPYTFLAPLCAIHVEPLSMHS